MDALQLDALYVRLWRAYGPQKWWPTTDADNPRFEILIGAVLTQHTAWTQVEKAIATLRAAGPLTPDAMLAYGQQLPELIRAAGPHNIKAERLRSLCRWFVETGGFEALDTWRTKYLRAALKSCRGIGPETADAILVYAFARPQFIADAYAFRIFERLGLWAAPRHYERLRECVEQAAGPVDSQHFNELHALLVAHAKQRCHKRLPACPDCCLYDRCAFAEGQHAAWRARAT